MSTLDSFTIETQDAKRESTIISYSIMSSEVLEYVFSKYTKGEIRKAYFNQYFREIFSWLIDYYAKYRAAPKQNIQSIFDNAKSTLSEDRSSIIEAYLNGIAEDYNFLTSTSINIEYIKETTISEFCTIQSTRLLIEELDMVVKSSNTGKINQLIDNFNKRSVSKEIDPHLGTLIPSRLSTIKTFFSEDNKRPLFSLHGTIGRFIGPFRKGATYAITGTEKSGKTSFMDEITFQAVVYNRLKALSISLEMTGSDKLERFYMRAGKFSSDIEHSGEHLQAIFDCFNNQCGVCKISASRSLKPLIRSINDVVSYYERPEWKVCTKCRSKMHLVETKSLSIEEKYIPSIWYKANNIPLITEDLTIKAIKTLSMFNIDNFRVKVFDRMTATFEEIEDYILAYRKIFKADVIAIDYPDIIKPSSGGTMDRFAINEIWMKCAGLASKLDIVLLIADQSNKLAREARSIRTTDTSEDKRKDGHIDLRITLNKTEEEDTLGIQRVGMSFRRKGKANHWEVMILQRLETANPIMDSEYWPHRFLRYPTVKEKQYNQ